MKNGCQIGLHIVLYGDFWIGYLSLLDLNKLGKRAANKILLSEFDDLITTYHLAQDSDYKYYDGEDMGVDISFQMSDQSINIGLSSGWDVDNISDGARATLIVKDSNNNPVTNKLITINEDRLDLNDDNAYATVIVKDTNNNPVSNKLITINEGSQSIWIPFMVKITNGIKFETMKPYNKIVFGNQIICEITTNNFINIYHFIFNGITNQKIVEDIPDTYLSYLTPSFFTASYKNLMCGVSPPISTKIDINPKENINSWNDELTLSIEDNKLSVNTDFYWSNIQDSIHTYHYIAPSWSLFSGQNIGWTDI